MHPRSAHNRCLGPRALGLLWHGVAVALPCLANLASCPALPPVLPCLLSCPAPRSTAAASAPDSGLCLAFASTAVAGAVCRRAGGGLLGGLSLLNALLSVAVPAGHTVVSVAACALPWSLPWPLPSLLRHAAPQTAYSTLRRSGRAASPTSGWQRDCCPRAERVAFQVPARLLPFAPPPPSTILMTITSSTAITTIITFTTTVVNTTIITSCHHCA